MHDTVEIMEMTQAQRRLALEKNSSPEKSWDGNYSFSLWIGACSL